MVSTPLTDDQARATSPHVTIWVGASAGTGKTHVLTARVLGLMLNGARPESILCLTYTKAAASEMKARLFEELGRWVLWDDARLAAEIKARTNLDADADLCRRARQLFTDVLDLPGGLNIQTFHAFCQSLLGRFPLEAGIAPGVTALDEVEQARLMIQARDQMLAESQRPGGQDLAAALSVMAARAAETQFADLIRDYVGAVPPAQKAHPPGLDAIKQQVWRTLDLPEGATEKSLQDTFLGLLENERPLLVRLQSLLASGTATEQKAAASLEGLLTARTTDPAGVTSVFLTDKDEPRKTVLYKKNRDAAPDLLPEVERLQDICAGYRQQQKLRYAAEGSAALALLGNRIISHYETAKKAEGMVDFADMVDRVVTMFRTSRIAPWVLYKLDARIDHILVDEAQDTNRDQWQVVEALADEFYAGDSARSDIERTVFAVGDLKQSIYSFQGADPGEFLAAQDRVFARADAVGAACDAVPLSLSFRSGAAVLRVVDTVFAPGSDARHGVVTGEEPLVHRVHRRGMAGKVHLWPLFVPKEEPSRPHWSLPLKQDYSLDTQEEAARAVARDIARQVLDGERLPSKGRARQAGDFLVLVRRRSRFYDVLTNQLKLLGVPVAGRDRMTLADELVVQDVLVVADIGLQSGDDLALAALLKGPLIGLSEEALFELAHGRGQATLYQRLQERQGEPAYAEAWAQLKAYIADAEAEPPASFLTRLLDPLGGRQRLRLRFGEEADEPLDALLEAAQGYEDRYSGGLAGFLSYIRGSASELKRESDTAPDAVRIMTIHGAKGLQAPIVYLADTTVTKWPSNEPPLIVRPDPATGDPVTLWTAGTTSAFQFERDAYKSAATAEYNRLLYVALTRAEDDLHIIGWQGAHAINDVSWYYKLSAAFDRLAVDSHTIVSLPDGRQVFRVAQTIEIEPKDEAYVAVIPQEPVPQWLRDQTAAPVEAADARPFTPTDEDRSAPTLSPLVRGSFAPVDRGTLIHQILEWAPDIPPGERAARIGAWLAQPGLGVAHDQQKELCDKVLTVLEDPSFKPLFAPGSRAEAALSGRVSDRFISGRIDRLCITADEVMIIDYKTHRQPPTVQRDVPEAILSQLKGYRDLLKQIYPEKLIKTGILWTEVPILMWVELEKL